MNAGVMGGSGKGQAPSTLPPPPNYLHCTSSLASPRLAHRLSLAPLELNIIIPRSTSQASIAIATVVHAVQPSLPCLCTIAFLLHRSQNFKPRNLRSGQIRLGGGAAALA